MKSAVNHENIKGSLPAGHSLQKVIGTKVRKCDKNCQVKRVLLRFPKQFEKHLRGHCHFVRLAR